MSGPGLHRTTWRELAVPLVIIAVTVYVLLRFSYDSLPSLQFLTPVPLAALAVLELVLARRVRAAVRHDPDAKAMAAIVIARCVALGKASSLVGSGVVGAALGLLARLLPDVPMISSATHDSAVGALLLLAAALLVAGGLLLERAGIDPNGGKRGSGAPVS